MKSDICQHYRVMPMLYGFIDTMKKVRVYTVAFFQSFRSRVSILHFDLYLFLSMQIGVEGFQGCQRGVR